MLKIEGIDIKKLPFDGLTLKSEFLEFEGMPLLSHYTDVNGNDIIAYWVDFAPNITRWLYAKISKSELFDYLIGKISLKALLENLASEFLFFVDIGETGNESYKLLYSNTLPVKYLPKEDSFYLKGLTDIYADYLTTFDYVHKLRENSFIFHVEAPDKPHSPTVGAKEAGQVLLNVTKSIEGYIQFKAYGLLKDTTSDVNRLNRRINGITNRLSPRISQAQFNSFEVWVAIDTLTYDTQDEIDTELKKTIIEGYKNDVLGLNYKNEKDAISVSEKYNEDERRKIFEPLIKIFANENYDVSVSDIKGPIRKDQPIVKASSKFKAILFPAPTIDEALASLLQKTKLVNVVLGIKEGQDYRKLNARSLESAMLFEQEIFETPLELQSPISAHGRSIKIKKPLRCILSITETGDLSLSNKDLNLMVVGNDVKDLSEEIQKQFIGIVDNIQEIAKKDNDIRLELEKYVSIDSNAV